MRPRVVCVLPDVVVDHTPTAGPIVAVTRPFHFPYLVIPWGVRVHSINEPRFPSTQEALISVLLRNQLPSPYARLT